MKNNTVLPGTPTENKKIYYLALLSAFFIPLKLSICLVFLIPLVLIWLYRNISNFPTILSLQQNSHVKPLFVFILVAVYSCIFGIDIQNSLLNFPSLIFFSFIPFAVSNALKSKNDDLRLVSALLCGQTVAGLQSIIELFFPGNGKQIFLGKVTESGQIALTFLIALGLIFFFNKNQNFKNRCKVAALFSMLILGLALLINLKRGPWLGVIAGSAVFLSIISKRILLTFFAVVLAIFVFVAPVRERVLVSYEHFSITGGREAIWDIGSELAVRYPLGIGYDNSYVLRKFSTEIPQELRHFHNNILNILVETGWLGLFVYLWWILSILRSSWTDYANSFRQILSRALGCAVVAWQAAGLVEYNFGDSEIFILLMIILGVLSHLKMNSNES